MSESTTRFEYLRIAIIGMVGYFILEWLRTSQRVSMATVWSLVAIVSIVAIAWMASEFVAQQRGDAVSVGYASTPARVYGGAWRFDETEDVPFRVGEHVMPLLPIVRPLLERALVDIQETPQGHQHEVVNGRVVYVKRLPPVATASDSNAGLLLAFSASPLDRTIRHLAIEEATDAVSPLAEESHDALQRVMAVVRART